MADVPTEISGLKLWLDADDAATITDTAGAVSQWDDKSGLNNHATQSTEASKPTTGSRTVNGLNVIDFDGVDDWLGLTVQPITGTEARTVIIMMLADNAASNNYGVSLSDTGGSGGTYNVTPEIALRINNANRIFGTSAIEDGVTPGIILFTNHANSTLELNANNFQPYKNGALLSGGSSVSPETLVNTDSGSPAIGAQFGGSNRLNGIIGEIIIYDKVLSAVERSEIDHYLGEKWNISVAGFITSPPGRIGVDPSGAGSEIVYVPTAGDLLTSGQTVIGVTDTSVVRTITISTADITNVDRIGVPITINDESGGAATNNIIIDTEGAETIDGVASVSITADYGDITLYSDGTNLFTV